MESLYITTADNTKNISIQKEYFEDLEYFDTLNQKPNNHVSDEERISILLEHSSLLHKLIDSRNIQLAAIALANGRCDVDRQKQLASVLFGIMYGFMYRTVITGASTGSDSAKIMEKLKADNQRVLLTNTNLTNKLTQYESSQNSTTELNEKIRLLTEQVNNRAESLDNLSIENEKLKLNESSYKKNAEILKLALESVENINTALRKDIEELKQSLSKATEGKSTNVSRPIIPPLKLSNYNTPSLQTSATHTQEKQFKPHLPLERLDQPFPAHSFNHSSSSKFQSKKSSVYPPMDKSQPSESLLQFSKSSAQQSTNKHPPLRSSVQQSTNKHQPLRSSVQQSTNKLQPLTHTSLLFPTQQLKSKTNLEKYLETVNTSRDSDE